VNILNSHNTERSLLRQTVLLSFLVCGFLILVDQLSVHWGLGIWQRVADDITGGIVAASIFYLYERRAMRRFREHLRLVDLMNHHIRNALQPLMFVPFQFEVAVQKQLVEECVNHIDWALREILPGKSQERFAVQAVDFGGNRSWTETSPVEPDPIEPDSIGSGPEGSTNSTHFGCEPETDKPVPLFGQWFDTWKDRNQTGPGEAVSGGFSDPVNSNPWKNYRAAFCGRKQRGKHA
jgi:hypothetical protein